MTFWSYILRCADGSYYTGHTDNLEQRIGQHQSRTFPDCYTASRLPVNLVFSQAHATRLEALAAEQQIKGWSRKKKEAMMRGDWAEVSKLAKSKTTPSIHGDLQAPSVELAEEQKSRGIESARGELRALSLPKSRGVESVRGELVEPPPSTSLRANGHHKEGET